MQENDQVDDVEPGAGAGAERQTEAGGQAEAVARPGHQWITIGGDRVELPLATPANDTAGRDASEQARKIGRTSQQAQKLRPGEPVTGR